jgi:hypothetical protein
MRVLKSNEVEAAPCMGRNGGRMTEGPLIA